MKNSNTEEIYHLDDDGSVVSLFFLHRQFFIMVDVITIKRLSQEASPNRGLALSITKVTCAT
jgi:hypothetical protein